ncbi:TetR/AcrR family transcriptional regulator [Nocardioides zeae]|uniref:TetR/AcrR family transcriptional regulator n=1 Tax=Nocardioides zeae TaxID=1457234 RepID=A0A6P0HGD4_9ACTN|nr:TetR/AcrR family transcriptional regulator [Nocardioides zeae]NEN77631.1 TetR/AcrR family transcriptional regulator [Nocardioides zeae]
MTRTAPRPRLQVAGNHAATPLPPGRPISPSTRRSLLMAGVEDLLETTVVERLSPGQVARHVGLAEADFTRAFSSVEEVVGLLLTARYEQQVAGADEVLSRNGDPRGAMSAALATAFHMWREHRALFLAVLDNRCTPTIAAAWEHWLNGCSAYLADYIRSVRGAGEALDGPALPTADDLAESLVDLGASALEHHLRRGGDEEDAVRVHTTMTHIWAASIFGTEASADDA